MTTQTDISEELGAAIAGLSHDVMFKDIDGNDTKTQKEIVYLHLKTYNVMVFIDHEHTDVEVWYDPIKTDSDWFKDVFEPTVKAIARRYLYGTSIRSYEGNIEPKELIHRTEKVIESRNSLKISYHPLGNTQIRLAHSKSVTEEKPGARSRNIKAVFIEKDGERFRFPYNHLLGARVMGLHVESGGKPWDNLGEKILEISRRRKEIMELLRWSKKLGETAQVNQIRERGKSEVVMLRRMMERAARTGDLTDINEYTLPNTDTVDKGLVSEAVAELDSALLKLLG